MVPDNALVERFRADLDALIEPGERIGIAVSGGPDSLALLMLAAAARPDDIEVATVDHGLRAGSREEAEMVADICERLGVPHAILAIEWDLAPIQRDPGAGARSPLRGAGAMGSGGAARRARHGASSRRPGRDAGDAPQSRFGCARACGDAAAERRTGRQGPTLAAAASRLAAERAGAHLHRRSGFAGGGPEQSRRTSRTRPDPPSASRCRMARSGSPGEERCEHRGRGRSARMGNGKGMVGGGGGRRGADRLSCLDRAD